MVINVLLEATEGVSDLVCVGEIRFAAAVEMELKKVTPGQCIPYIHSGVMSACQYHKILAKN